MLTDADITTGEIYDLDLGGRLTRVEVTGIFYDPDDATEVMRTIMDISGDDKTQIMYDLKIVSEGPSLEPGDGELFGSAAELRRVDAGE